MVYYTPLMMVPIPIPNTIKRLQAERGGET
jgi:hypothetical protein